MVVARRIQVYAQDTSEYDIYNCISNILMRQGVSPLRISYMDVSSVLKRILLYANIS
jgi:hypothetical protein